MVVLGVFGGCDGSAADIVGGEAVEALRICDCILEILAMDLWYISCDMSNLLASISRRT